MSNQTNVQTKKAPKLTPLHWCVYRFLEASTLEERNYVSQNEIYQHCLDQGHKVTWNENKANHNCHCRWLVKVVDDLNSALEIDHIIAHHGYRYWIASEQEAEALVRFYELKIECASAKKWALKAKMRRHGQGKTTTNRAETMEGSKAEPFHETYNRWGKNDEETN